MFPIRRHSSAPPPIRTHQRFLSGCSFVHLDGSIRPLRAKKASILGKQLRLAQRGISPNHGRSGPCELGRGPIRENGLEDPLRTLWAFVEADLSISVNANNAFVATWTRELCDARLAIAGTHHANEVLGPARPLVVLDAVATGIRRPL